MFSYVSSFHSEPHVRVSSQEGAGGWRAAPESGARAEGGRTFAVSSWAGPRAANALSGSGAAQMLPAQLLALQGVTSPSGASMARAAAENCGMMTVCYRSSFLMRLCLCLLKNIR